MDSEASHQPHDLLEPSFLQRYVFRSAVALTATVSLAIHGFSKPWAMWTFILLIAVPVMWSLASVAASRREHALAIWRHDSPIRSWLAGPTLRVIFSIVLGVVLAFVFFSKLTVLSKADLILLIAAIPAFGLTSVAFYKQIGADISFRQSMRFSIVASSLVTVGVLTLLSLAFLRFWPEWSEPFATSGPASNWRLPDAELSAGYRLAMELAQTSNGLEDWSKDEAARHNVILSYVLSFLLQVGSFGGALAIFTFFLLPQIELKRAILPAETAAGTRPLTREEIAWPTAVAVFCILFIYFPLVSEYEKFARTVENVDVSAAVQERLPVDRAVPGPLQNGQGRATPGDGQINIPSDGLVETPALQTQREVVRIGDDFFEPDIVETLVDAGAEIEALNAKAKAEAALIVQRSFDEIRGSVPVFLDWYYSLTGEYGRTIATLGGSGEEYLEEKLRETLADVGGQEDELDTLVARYEEDLSLLLEQYKGLINRNRITLAPGELPIEVATYDAEEIFLPDISDGFITQISQRRLGTVVGGASGIVAAAVARKVAMKGVFKVATKAVVKAAASKGIGGSGGAAGGAVAGAAVGSIVPGVGTAVGAVVGGVVGAVVGGVAVDKLVLELEEYFSRESFEAQILAAINEVEAEALAGMRCNASHCESNAEAPREALSAE